MGKGDNYRPVDTTKYEKNYTTIFGDKGRACYGGGSLASSGNTPSIEVKDKHGNKIKLNSRQKNVLYKQAREIKAGLPNSMCTRSETHRTDDHVVSKMLRSEFKEKGNIEKFQKIMKSLGADPKECNTERLRRR